MFEKAEAFLCLLGYTGKNDGGIAMDKLTMEDLGYFLYMQEMERQQQAEQEAEEAEGPEDDDGDE